MDSATRSTIVERLPSRASRLLRRRKLLRPGSVSRAHHVASVRRGNLVPFPMLYRKAPSRMIVLLLLLPVKHPDLPQAKRRERRRRSGRRVPREVVVDVEPEKDVAAPEAQDPPLPDRIRSR
jgi:hypothetical protein